MKCSSIYICVVGLLFLFTTSSYVPVDNSTTGTIRGFVLTEDQRAPLYANVVVLGTNLGTMTQVDGSFELDSIPAGVHRVRAVSMGYHPSDLTELIIKPGTILKLNIMLRPHGITEEAAWAESIGVDVSACSEDFYYEIIPSNAKLKVGDSPPFKVGIRNNSNEIVYLIHSIDGSTTGRRYPHALVAIEGPPDGIEMAAGPQCGTITELQVPNFVKVHPGDVFDLYGAGWTPDVFRDGKFSKPGRYKVTFEYSTNEGDIRKWLGFPPTSSIDPQISELIRRVPRIVITKSIYVNVYE